MTITLRNNLSGPGAGNNLMTHARTFARMGIEVPDAVKAAEAEVARVREFAAATPSRADLRADVARLIANGEKITATMKTDLAVADDLATAAQSAYDSALRGVVAAWRVSAPEALELARPVFDEANAEFEDALSLLDPALTNSDAYLIRRDTAGASSFATLPALHKKVREVQNAARLAFEDVDKRSLWGIYDDPTVGPIPKTAYDFIGSPMRLVLRQPSEANKIDADRLAQVKAEREGRRVPASRLTYTS